MAANGTDQSGLYDLRGGTDTDYRDRSMEQSNTTNGNPQGYIPPTFNPNTGTWANTAYSNPQGLILPTGPGQMLSMPMNAFAAGNGNSPLGGNKYASPLVLPGLTALSGNQNSTPSSTMTVPSGATGNGNSTPSGAPVPSQLSLPQTPSQIAGTPLGYIPLSAQPPANTPVVPQTSTGDTTYQPSPYQASQPAPAAASINDSTAYGSHLRHMKAIGIMPIFTSDAKAKAGGGKSGNNDKRK